MRRPLAWIAIATIVIAGAAMASDTITYNYDARGRLVKVVRTSANNTTTNYTLDKADNRTLKQTTSP